MNNFQSHISHVANTRAAQGSGGVSNAWIGVIFFRGDQISNIRRGLYTRTASNSLLGGDWNHGIL